MKCAWRFNDSRGTVRNRPYKKHLHAAANDLVKLGTVDPGRREGIAFLLVGFDHLTKPIPEADINIVRMNATGPEWREFYSDWIDRRPDSGRVRVWFWFKNTV